MDDTLFKQALHHIEKNPDSGQSMYKVWFSSEDEFKSFYHSFYEYAKIINPQGIVELVIGALYIGWTMHKILVEKERHGSNGFHNEN